MHYVLMYYAILAALYYPSSIPYALRYGLTVCPIIFPERLLNTRTV